MIKRYRVKGTYKATITLHVPIDIEVDIDIADCEDIEALMPYEAERKGRDKVFFDLRDKATALGVDWGISVLPTSFSNPSVKEVPLDNPEES